MSDFLEFLGKLTEHPIIAGVAVTIICSGILFIARARNDRIDSKAIYDFLVESSDKSKFDFRNTAAISSHTNISEKRVEILCAKHPGIRRNEKERQSWTLTDKLSE